MEICVSVVKSKVYR